MPPENTNPVAKTDSSEFEFDAPPPENPRMRKRNLKVKPAAETVSAAAADRPAVYAQPAAATHTAPNGPVYARPSGTAERTQPAPASGVLYYSSNPGTKKEDSMKSIPHQQAARPASASTAPRPNMSASQPVTSRPMTSAGSSFSPRSASAAATPQASPARSAQAAPSNASSHATPASSHTAASASRAVSTTVAGPSSSARPAAGVSDYRSNIDRQSREQKSIGSILNLAVYALIGLFLVAGLLAGYGAHDVYKQLHAQSTTVSELDARYSAANQALNDKLASNQAGIQQIQTQLSHSQELLLRQQDMITKMQATLDTQTQALREERATRAAETSIREQETSVLRSRMRSLEARTEASHP